MKYFHIVSLLILQSENALGRRNPTTLFQFNTNNNRRNSDSSFRFKDGKVWDQKALESQVQEDTTGNKEQHGITMDEHEISANYDNREEEEEKEGIGRTRTNDNDNDILNQIRIQFLQSSDMTFSLPLPLPEGPSKVTSWMKQLESTSELFFRNNRKISDETSFETYIDNLVQTAEIIARDFSGVDVDFSEAAAQARATTKYTTEFLRVANGVLLYGYANQEGKAKITVTSNDVVQNLNLNGVSLDGLAVLDGTSASNKPLFHNFDSVQNIPPSEFHHVSKQSSKMASLSGAIYQDTLPTIHKLGHSMVANGTSAEVTWMITDSIGYEKKDFGVTTFDDEDLNFLEGAENPTIIRAITIRGFDASDENIDRERLVTEICYAEKTNLTKNIQVHRGLLRIAQEIYTDIKPYIDGPHKVVLTGHSIGGALSNLLLMLITLDRGPDFVKEKIKRVYTFGSPPIASLSFTSKSNTTTSIINDDLDQDQQTNAEYDNIITDETSNKMHNDEDNKNPITQHDCSILKTLGLPSNLVYAFIQPWDPIPRLFSQIDAMYPLIGDLGLDGTTLYASGPPRTLRPITRAILESWENWPQFRDNNRYIMKQDYSPIGVQHLLMPDPARYLTDRLLSVNVNAYPVHDVLRVSSDELYDALEEAFPLDVFSISLVPTAIRSFIHHFFPAYVEGMISYIQKEEPDS